MIIEALFGGISNRMSSSFSRDPASPFWYDSAGGYSPVAAGETVNQTTALSYSAVWAATRIIAGTGSWLPLNLYRRNEGVGHVRGQELAEDRSEHWLLNRQPNNLMTSIQYRMLGLAHQVNWGNHYAEIQRDGSGIARQIWPIHPSRVTPYEAQDTGELFYEVKNNNADPVYIPYRDMFHVPSMITDDGIMGKGVIQNARESIGFGIATEKYGAGWFGNGAIPRVVVKHPGRFDPVARDNFRKDWKQIYGGASGDKVALLEAGADITQMNITPEDSQFLGTRQHNVEEIARWYGVPPHMLQQLMHATYRNAEELGIQFVIFSLIQWLAIWEQIAWMKIIPTRSQKELFYEHKVDALLRGDSKTRAEFYAKMIQHGVINRNEARSLENLNPVPGGDKFLVQGAMMPIDENGNVSPPNNQSQQGMPNQTPVQKPEDDEDKEQLNTLNKIKEVTQRNMEISESVKETMEAATSSNVSITEEQWRAIFDESLSKNQNSQLSLVPRAAVITGCREMLSDAFARMESRELREIIKHSKKLSTFNKSIEEFYDDHAGALATALRAPCIALSAMGIEADYTAIASDFCNTYKTQVFSWAEAAKTGKLQEALTDLTIAWKDNIRGNQLVSCLLPGEINAP